MKRTKLWLVTVSLLFLLAFGATAQKSKSQKPVKKTTVEKPIKKTAAQKPGIAKPVAGKSTSPLPGLAVDSTQNERKVRDMVAFLEFMLNTLGSAATSSRDKDVLITESYSKIFRDGNVQIEDDLDEEREVVTNKSVVAYLKDVDFFFTDVKFEFSIEGIQRGENANNKLFYKVSLKRNLKGTTADGKPVNNTIPRYIEINYNPDDQDLRIASIYTNEFNEKDALFNWWKQLSLEWQTVFKEKLPAAGRNLTDSLALDEIKNITSIEALDLSNNRYIQNIEPLSQLTGLKSLNLSKTNIGDLNPIRNLTELVELDLSKTRIQDLSWLKYSDKLARLNISHTAVSDLSVIQKMPKLQYLDVSATNVTDLAPLNGLVELVQLNLKGTRIQKLSPLESLVQMTVLNVSSTLIEDLNPLKGLKNLTTLDLDSTHTNNINALSGLENLRILHANYTMISDLQPLQKLVHLEKIYCDKTPIKATVADAFMAANPKVLVVFDTEDLMAWWQTLTGEWQDILSKTAKIGLTPTKDELAKITNVDSINFGGRDIIDLTPLRKLLKLRAIIANNTSISDLSPLGEHHEIRYVDISETEVSDISALGKFAQLKVLRADKSKIQNIEPLFGATGLQRLYVDQTAIHDITAQEFLERNPKCLLVYKTIHLNRWWNKLPENWKEVFRSQMTGDTSASRENLHKLVEQQSFHFKEAQVNDLSAFSEFVQLKELHFSGTAISDLAPLVHFASLKSLHATNSPIQQMESLSQLPGMEDLDISNTPIDELKGIGSLANLKKLNCSGTQIKKLDLLKILPALEYLDCSNTRVGNLDPVSHRSLKTLKCYNTKVSSREFENFKKSNPECSVVYYR